MLKNGILYFELKRFTSRRNLVVLGGFILALLLSCWYGTVLYRSTIANKSSFQATEQERKALCKQYTFRGIPEARLLFVPGPLSIIFHESGAFTGLTARVEAVERPEMNTSLIGKGIFANVGGCLDFAGIMFICGALLALLYGYEGTHNRGLLRYISSLSGYRNPGFLISLARVLLVNMVILVLYGLAPLWFLLTGTHGVNILFLAYLPGLLLLITGFTLIGALTGTLENKTTRLLLLPSTYFVLVFLLPWLLRAGTDLEAQINLPSAYNVEHEILKHITANEKEMLKNPLIMKSGEPLPENTINLVTAKYEALFQQIHQLDISRLDDIRKRMNTYQTLSALFPTTFYLSVSRELSGKGFQEFEAFYRYACDTQLKLASFQLKQRFSPPPGESPESFFTGNEYLFLGKSRIPGNFLLGTVLGLLYIMALLWALSQRSVTGQKKKPLNTTTIDFSERNTHFALCKDNRVKEAIIRDSSGQPGTGVLTKTPVTFSFDSISGIRANTLLRFFCRLAKTDHEKAREHAAIMGITDLHTLPLTAEDFLKLYAAAMTAEERVKTIILDDFFKGETRRFEQECMKLLEHLEASGKKILYLGCDMYRSPKALEDDISIDTYCLFPLPLDKITLR